MEGRTGSTLLMTLLATSDEIAFDRRYPYEARYHAYLAHLLEPVGEEFRPDRDGAWTMTDLLRGPADRFGPMPFVATSVDRVDFRNRLLRHAWAAFSESVAAHSGRLHRYYAEKTWGRAVEVFAEAGIATRFIGLVRDPRDVCASIRAFDRQRGFYGFGRAEEESEEHYLGRLVGQMTDNLRVIDASRGRYDSQVLRYEDLVLDLPGCARRLSDWLGVAIHADRREHIEQHVQVHATASTARESIGRWRRDLSDREAAFVTGEMREWLLALGYEH
jgi:hypothetical protein